MKKILLLSSVLAASVLYADSFQLEQICDGAGNLNGTETEIAKKFPLGDCNALSKSRGGNLDDIDAINDGTGSAVVSPLGQNVTSTQAKMRNTKFIEAVREHGNEAKNGTKSVVAYLNENDIDTEALVREADAKDGELSSEPTLTDTYATATILFESNKLSAAHMNLADIINDVKYRGTTVNWTGIHSLSFGNVEDTVYFGGKTVRVGTLQTGRHYYSDGRANYPTNAFELYSSEDGISWKLEYSVGSTYDHTHVMDFDTKYLKLKSVGRDPDTYWRFFRNTMRDSDTTYITYPRWDIKEYSE